MHKLFIVSLSILMFGCASGSRQYLRLVSMDVYNGLDTIKTDSIQAGKEANARYDKLYNMTKDVLTEHQKSLGMTDVDLEDSIKILDEDRQDFRDSTKLNTRVDLMADEVKKGLGWKEGPTDPLPYLLWGGAGLAAGAAAF